MEPESAVASQTGFSHGLSRAFSIRLRMIEGMAFLNPLLLAGVPGHFGVSRTAVFTTILKIYSQAQNGNKRPWGPATGQGQQPLPSHWSLNDEI